VNSECRQVLLYSSFAILCEHLYTLCVTKYRQVRQERESTQRIRKGFLVNHNNSFIVSMSAYAFTIDAVYGILLCVVCSFSGQRSTIGRRHFLGEIFVLVAKLELQSIRIHH
jgi:hypothetical protein